MWLVFCAVYQVSFASLLSEYISIISGTSTVFASACKQRKIDRGRKRSASRHINTIKRARSVPRTQPAARRPFHNFGQNKSQLSLSAPRAAAQTWAAEQGWSEVKEGNPELSVQVQDPGGSCPARAAAPGSERGTGAERPGLRGAAALPRHRANPWVYFSLPA